VHGVQNVENILKRWLTSGSGKDNFTQAGSDVAFQRRRRCGIGGEEGLGG